MIKQINFVKYIPLYFLISGVVIGVGLFSLIKWGLRPAVDFTGGSLIEVKIIPNDNLPVTEENIRTSLLIDEIEVNQIQSAGDGWMIRTKEREEDIQKRITEALDTSLGATTVVRLESVGPTLGKELLQKTLVSVILASLGILLYVAYRFGGSKYGICADIAMLHDSLVLIGSFALFGHLWGMEVDTLFVTAVLTILSFSVHDTIVVYDRIRENLRRYPRESYDEIVNRSTNETLNRSINNSLTIIFMLLALTILGGQTIKPFSLALLVGTITGTYSSTFTAAPLLVIWNRIGRLRKKK